MKSLQILEIKQFSIVLFLTLFVYIFHLSSSRIECSRSFCCAILRNVCCAISVLFPFHFRKLSRNSSSFLQTLCIFTSLCRDCGCLMKEKGKKEMDQNRDSLTWLSATQTYRTYSLMSNSSFNLPFLLLSLRLNLPFLHIHFHLHHSPLPLIRIVPFSLNKSRFSVFISN